MATSSTSQRGNAAPSDPFELLEIEHREVEQMLEQLAQDPPEEQVQQLVEQLQLALTTHMSFEEQEIYPLLAAMDPETSEEAEIEHGLAREGLTQLVSMAGQPGFGAAVEMLKAGILHHVEEEENEAFPTLRESVDQDRRRQLLETAMAGRAAAGLPPVDPSLRSSTRGGSRTSSGGGGLENRSKDELLEMAREQGVEGRSSMTKAELARALSER